MPFHIDPPYTDFCDVTLACEDDQIEKHKVVIFSCSPVLKKLKLNKNPNQLTFISHFSLKLKKKDS